MCLDLSFTNALSFAASDVVPLSRWAKLMMMLQPAASAASIVLVIAWAVDLLGYPARIDQTVEPRTMRRQTCPR
jgi:hypothetical protein